MTKAVTLLTGARHLPSDSGRLLASADVPSALSNHCSVVAAQLIARYLIEKIRPPGIARCANGAGLADLT